MSKKLSLYILLFLFLCGCASRSYNIVSDEYQYETRELMYSEEDSVFSFRTDMDYTETKLARYYFDLAIEDVERQSCIKATEEILDALTDFNVTPSIYVFTDDRYSGKYVVNNSLYITVQDWQTLQYATDVLLAVYGEFSHYGLAYGYANLICSEYQWEGCIQGRFVNPDVSDSCDLNLLCFDTAFCSYSDVEIARLISCDFVSSYIAQYGEDEFQRLLSVSDTAEGMQYLKDKLSAYYQSNNFLYEPSIVRYSYGGVSFDYIVCDDLATFYVGTDWKDLNRDCNPLVSDDFLHGSYTDLKAFYEINLQQMQRYQDLFALDNYNDDLRIIFLNGKSLSQYSFYQPQNHTIYVMNVDSLMHEYIHALTQPKLWMDDWQTEGFARYFSYRYDYYGVAFLNQDYNNVAFSSATKYIYEYFEVIDRPIDMAIDYAEIENIAVYSRDYKDPNSSYVAGSSFIQYLVNQYGEKAVIDFIYGDESLFEKTYEELVADWVIYIDKSYSNYSKYSY